MTEENRLGREPIGKLLLSLSIPSIIGQIVNLLYNIVDRIYIGHIPEIGGIALTGIGVTMPLTLIISAFAALVGMGGAPRAAIKMGENDNDGAEKIMGNCTTLVVGFSLLLTIIFLTFGKTFLRWFGASDITLPYALDYMQIYVVGTIFVQITLGLNPFINTQGFSKVGMMTVLIGAITNIVLDPIFIFGFHMGVKGAALATIISQGVSALWVLKFLTGPNTTLRIQKQHLSLKSNIIGPVILLGLSPFVMQITESLLNITFNSSLQTYGGDAAVGAMTILSSIMQFLLLPLMGLTQGAQPIISYNYGAGKKERMVKAFRLLFIASLGYCLAFWALTMVFPQFFVSIFTKDTAILETATWALRVYMAAAFVMGAQIACQQTFIAVGKAKESLFLAILRKIFLLIPLIFILPRLFDDKVFAVFLAEPVSDVIAVIVTVTLFVVQFRKLIQSMPDEPIEHTAVTMPEEQLS